MNSVSTDYSNMVETLLRSASDGSTQAQNELMALVYSELRTIAQRRLAACNYRGMSATSVVQEACKKLLGRQSLIVQERRHFYFLLGRAMRDVIANHVAHADATAKAVKGGSLRIGLAQDGEAEVDLDAAELRAALDALRQHDPDAAEVVVLRFFSGLSLREVKDLLGCSLAEVRGHWDYASAWLHRRLSKGV